MLGVGRNVGGGLGDEDDDGPGQQDDDQSDYCRGDDLLGFLDVLFISGGGQPDKATVDDQHDSNQGHQPEDESDDVQDRSLEVGVAETNLTANRLNAKRRGRSRV